MPAKSDFGKYYPAKVLTRIRQTTKIVEPLLYCIYILFYILLKYLFYNRRKQISAPPIIIICYLACSKKILFKVVCFAHKILLLFYLSLLLFRTFFLYLKGFLYCRFIPVLLFLCIFWTFPTNFIANMCKLYNFFRQ